MFLNKTESEERLVPDQNPHQCKGSIENCGECFRRLDRAERRRFRRRRCRNCRTRSTEASKKRHWPRPKRKSKVFV